MFFGARLRIFYVTVVIALWILFIDVIGNDGVFTDDKEWEIWMIFIGGFIMASFGLICAIFILVWFCARCAGLSMAIAIFIAAIMRFVAVMSLSNWSWGASSTDFAILALQVYLVFEGLFVLRS